MSDPLPETLPPGIALRCDDAGVVVAASTRKRFGPGPR